MILGQNLGLGEIWRREDIAEGAANGAPNARILCRWLGKEPPPGYGTNPMMQGTLVFPHHTFARSPRDFFMLELNK